MRHKMISKINIKKTIVAITALLIAPTAFASTQTCDIELPENNKFSITKCEMKISTDEANISIEVSPSYAEATNLPELQKPYLQFKKDVTEKLMSSYCGGQLSAHNKSTAVVTVNDKYDLNMLSIVMRPEDCH